MQKQRLIRQANEITKAIYSMTIEQKRIIATALWKHSRGEICEDGWITLRVKDIADVCNIDSSSASKLLKRGVANINKADFTLKDRFRNELIRGNWVQTYKTPFDLEKRGVYAVQLNSYIVKVMALIREKNKEYGNKFTSYFLEESVMFKNIYSARIYEMVKMVVDKDLGVGSLNINLDTFRKELELPEVYDNYAELNRRIIKPSLAEIAKVAGLASCEPIKIKKGRKVVNLLISFTVE